MQSKNSNLLAYGLAVVAALVAFALAFWLRETVGALLWTLVCGALFGFVAPRGAWRWALILSTWIIIAMLLHTSLGSAPQWCSGLDTVPPHQPGWVTALIALALAVAFGVCADWILSEALRRCAPVQFTWIGYARPALRIAAVAAAALIVFGCAVALVQPLQPFGIGDTYCWDEFCFAVTAVKREKTIGAGSNQAVANGTFYIVSADMGSPWWGRFYWGNDAVFVTDYAGTNYGYSLRGQLAYDRLTGSERSRCHLIRGASERETIVFDLPDDVVQPRLLIRDTLGLEGLIGGVRARLLYIKPAFNLRYD